MFFMVYMLSSQYPTGQSSAKPGHHVERRDTSKTTASGSHVLVRLVHSISFLISGNCGKVDRGYPSKDRMVVLNSVARIETGD